jgi:hypothetical protein
MGEYGTASDDFWDYVGGFEYGLFHGEGELACVDGRHFKGTSTTARFWGQTGRCYAAMARKGIRATTKQS